MNGFRPCRAATAFAVAATFLLAGCGTTQAEPELVIDPYLVGEPVPEIDTSELRLPASFEELPVVDPGWSTAPKYADGVFLAAAERPDALEFMAVDIYGDALWAVQRPLTCTGFTITTDDAGRKLAILTDTQTTDTALAGTTATAYELTTGDQAWGPVDVPGPLQGPGLVFAPPAPNAAMGDTGPRTALDPNTGNVVIAESDSGEERVFGEYHGVLLVTDKDALMARSATDGQDLWRIPLADHGWAQDSLRPSIAASPGEGYALIQTSDSSGALLNLDDGTVISETAQEAAFDLLSNTLAIRDELGLHAYDNNNELLWSLSANPETTITALGGVLLYLRDGAAVRVHNVITGEVAQAYAPNGKGRIVVPVHITETGGALLLDGQRHLIATVEHPPGMDDLGS